MVEMRRGKLTHWITGGDLAVGVRVEVVYPPEIPSMACLEPPTLLYLDGLRDALDAGDVKSLAAAGEVFRAVKVSAARRRQSSPRTKSAAAPASAGRRRRTLTPAE